MHKIVKIKDASLHLADCEAVLHPWATSKVDLLLTDPPYGIGEAAKNHQSRNRVRGGKAIISTDYGQDAWDDEPPSASQIASLVDSAELSILWGGNYFGLPAASKWLVCGTRKTVGTSPTVSLLWTNLPGAVRIFRHMWNGMLRASERNTPRVHPTQKPVALMDWCIAQAGDIGTVLGALYGIWHNGRCLCEHGERNSSALSARNGISISPRGRIEAANT